MGLYLPHGYQVGFGITRQALERGMRGLSGEDCAQYQNLFDIYNRLAKKSGKSASTIANAKRLRDENLAKYYACLKANAPAPTPVPASPPPVTPVAPTPQPPVQSQPPVQLQPSVSPETVVGTPPAGYVPPAPVTGGGLPLPVPPANPYPTPSEQVIEQQMSVQQTASTPSSPSATPAPAAPKVYAECDLPSLGMLPMTYRDKYGPMKVLQLFCGSSAQTQAVQQQATPAQQTPSGFDTSSAALWGG